MQHEYTDVRFDLPHIQLQGLRGGTPGGPFLLLLHGWLDNCHSFLPMLPYLNDFDWVAVDFAGHGHSAHRSADAQYYFVDYVYDIQCLIAEQGWQDVHVLGHSMGGYVAQLLSACFPTAIRSLCCIEAFGLVTGAPEDALTQLQKGFSSRLKQQNRTLPVYPDLQHLHHARAKAGDFDAALGALLLQRNLRDVEGGYSWRTDPRVRTVSPFRFTEAQVPAVLAGLTMPMQLLLGQDGHADLRDAVSRWGDQVPQLRIANLPGGHHVHMQAPEQTATLVIDHFLSN